MKLKYQLFVVLLISSALLIALMLAANSISFHRQFITYVNAVQVKRLAPLIEELTSLHDENAGWAWVNKSTWNDLLRKHDVHNRTGRPAPPRMRDRAPNGQKKNERRRKPPPKFSAPWLTLVNPDKSIVIGPAPSKSQMEWIPVTSGIDKLGYVGFIRHDTFSNQLDQEFAKQQRRNSFFAALAMVVLCALITAPLAARIIRPLTAVNKAIGALSAGDYSYRTSINRKDELGDLAANINRLGDTLEDNKAARQRWIAEISHELRTPVAVLQGEIEAIQDGIRSANPETIESLHAEIIRLSRLIDDLHQLSVSDLGALDYRMEALDLGHVIGDFLDSHRQQLDDASIELTLHNTSLIVHADHERIFQLLDNLLQNTIRYTESPGSLSVTASRKNNVGSIVWEDSSPGVSDEDLELLFEPLYRAEKSRNRKTSGSGLGLSIATKIVSAHGGTLRAAHSPLGGLQLHMDFPLNTQAPVRL